MKDVHAWLTTQTGTPRLPGTLAVYRDAAEAVRDLDTDVERLRRERSRLIDVYTDGDISRADYRMIRGAIDAAIQHLGQRVVAVLEQQPAAGDNLEPALTRLCHDGDRLPTAEHRDTLDAVLHHVLVMPGPYGPGKIQPVARWNEAAIGPTAC